MTLKTYPAYKDSGVEWIGKIPQGWEIKKYKRAFNTQNGHGFPNELQGNKTGDFPFLKVSDISFKGKYVEKAANYVSKEIIDEKGWNIVETNSILTAKIGEALRKNHRKINKLPCLIDNNTMALIPKPNIRTQFLYYLSTIIDFDWYCNPGAVPSLNNSYLREDYFAMPSLKEQKTISMFLESSLSETSNLITQKENMIQLISEKRQAVITEAVTKGLSPNVPMKDSGFEWIGKIPAHWTTSRLDFISKVKARLGWKGLKADEYVDEGYILLSTPNLRGREIEFDNVDYITEERYLESPEIMLEVGDVLLVKDGSTLGITNVVRELPKEATVNSSTAVIRPTNQVDSIYLYYYLTSTYIQDIVNQVKDGMGVPHLFQSDINKFKILLPPLSEQIQIGQFLDKSTYQVEQTIESIQAQIKILKEYRESLIYEAVTGKIDLRDYKGGEYDGD